MNGNFAFHAPTGIYFGENCVNEQKRVINSFGRRAFIITSVFAPGSRNYALEDFKNLLGELGVEYCVYSDVEENPSVESIERVTRQIRSYKPDYIIAIGGGSALDTAKAANVLLTRPAMSDAYLVFYGGTMCANSCNSGKLPMLAVPTTAGSGSEVMGYAILTRADTNTKLRINQLSYFEAAFLDARYVAESPQWLLDAGAMDALAHGIEGVLNRVCSPMQRVWHEYGFRLFAQYKDALLNGSLTREQCGDMLMAASAHGMGTMQSGTTIPHGMGYPLTHFKKVTHGIASIMSAPSFLPMLHCSDEIDSMLEMCGFSGLKEFTQYINAIVRRNVNISVTRSEIEAWSDECFSLKRRIVKHVEPITRGMIRDIYLETLDPWIAGAAPAEAV